LIRRTADVSRVVVGDSDTLGNAGHIIAPLSGLALALTSWARRPDSRKLVVAVDGY